MEHNAKNQECSFQHIVFKGDSERYKAGIFERNVLTRSPERFAFMEKVGSQNAICFLLQPFQQSSIVSFPLVD